jgi:anti-anti-sigma factor
VLTEQTSHDGINIVTVNGEIDIASAQEFGSSLEAAARDGRSVVVSLAPCPYIDSSGLRVLVRLSNELASRCAIVVPPGTQTRRIFDITGLGYQMRLCDSLEDALAALKDDAATN